MEHPTITDPDHLASIEKQLGLPPNTLSEFQLLWDEGSEPSGEKVPMFRARMKASALPDFPESELALPTVELEVDAHSRPVTLLAMSMGQYMMQKVGPAMDRRNLGVQMYKVIPNPSGGTRR